MDIKYGLFSCDSHAQLDRDAWTKRLSKEKWRERIPQIVRTQSERLANRSMLDFAAAEGSAALLEHLRALFSYQLM